MPLIQREHYSHAKTHIKEYDDRTVNQIDNVMINHWHWSNLLDFKSYRGANVDLDHYLVISRLTCCTARRNNNGKHNFRHMKTNLFFLCIFPC